MCRVRWQCSLAGHGASADEIERHLSRARAGEIVRNGLDVVIIGAPNAGKSSLLNALAGRDVSIITEEAGTTRDLVEARLDIGRIPRQSSGHRWDT